MTADIGTPRRCRHRRDPVPDVGRGKGWAMLRRRVADEEYRALRALLAAPAGTAERARIVLAMLAQQAGLPRTTVYSEVRRFALYDVARLDNRRCAGQRPGELPTRCDGATATARSSVRLAVGTALAPGARNVLDGAVRTFGPQDSGR